MSSTGHLDSLCWAMTALAVGITSMPGFGPLISAALLLAFSFLRLLVSSRSRPQVPSPPPRSSLSARQRCQCGRQGSHGRYAEGAVHRFDNSVATLGRRRWDRRYSERVGHADAAHEQ